ncbi:hypothetical protein [Peterkaempfera bronchialis]|uniref:hypothetical protein n=1 Tax=Peterkaempfera bronchialis TaxID=2126346 RepID=UPI003C2CCC01
MTRRNSWETGTSGGAAVHPHIRAELLSEVSTDGVIGLTRVLRAAGRGDQDAAQMPVAALLRALPGMGSLTAHELLRSAHIREDQQVRDLDAYQWGPLLQIMSRLSRARYGIR